jgi:CheY-like chemotaxis protein
MKKILIVLNDAILMSVFKSWVFRSQKKDSLLFAKDGKEAVEIIKSCPIDLLMTDLSLPEMDGLELVTGISLPYPELKIAFFITTVSIGLNEKLKSLTSVYFINKPNSLREFIHLVSVMEVTDVQALSVADILIADFLELIECQKKTCLLSIEKDANQQKGLIYFEHGVLYDAVYGDFKAEPAVVEMLSWQHAKLIFKTLANKQFRRQIQSSLSSLIKGGTNLKAKAEEEAKNALALQAKIAQEQQAKAEAAALQTKMLAEAQAKVAAQEKIASENKIKAAQQAKIAADAKAKSEEQAKAQAALHLLSVKISALSLEETLLPLQDIEDYLASAVFDMTGQIVIKHKAANSTHSIEDISIDAVMLIKTALETVTHVGLGKFNFIQVMSEGGIFEAGWVLENQLVGAVLLSSKAKNTGLAKIRLIKTCEFIRARLL